MTSRRADIARFRQSPGDLIVDLFEAGTSLRGRPHANLKQRTSVYYQAGSYTRSSSHQCFVCKWPFQSRARLAGAFLIAIPASEPRPASAAVGAVCNVGWAAKSLPEIEEAATILLRAVRPGGRFSSQPNLQSVSLNSYGR